MATPIQTEQRRFLETTLGNRVSFDRLERKLYGHDIASIPSLVKPLVSTGGNTLPDGIVQPRSEEELVELVKWAYANGIPLTPRGKSTSGYGGVLPVKHGLVVDFHYLNKVTVIDGMAMTATVEPGIVWEVLDRELRKHKLTLRLYPTSYPASTVGGWLAQGGAGIGSFESGWFRENVIRARVVLPNGETKAFTGNDLEVISDAEGTTGFITEVTLKVRPLERLQVLAIGAKNAADMQKLAQAIIGAKLPIWSFIFTNPRMAELKNEAPLRMHNGHPAEHRVVLPEMFITTLAYRMADDPVVMPQLKKIIAQTNCETLSDEIANHEWRNRFKLMTVKRLGPSLVPAEVVVPLDQLGDFLNEIEQKITQPLVKEAVVIREGRGGKPEVVVLGFIPGDQRTLGYNFVFGLVLSVLKIAEKHGGRAYSTGMYFTRKINDVLGKERAAHMKAFKQQVDPKNLLNPGKVYDAGVLGTALGLAEKLEGLIRPFGNAINTKIGERIDKPVRDVPADVAWYAYACSQCGYCVNECDQFYGRGWESQSPRGKWYWLREYMEGREDWNQQIVDSFLVCTTCELCNIRCSANLPIEPSWMKLRGKMIHEDKRMTFPPFEMMSAALTAEGDIWAGYRKDRDEWFPEDLKEKHGPEHKSKNVYFAGCTASYVEHDIGIGSVRLLDEAGVDFTYLGQAENCCGTPMLVAGNWDVFGETMKKNIAAVKAAGADTVISSCPACDMMWRQVYPEWAKKLGIEYGITAKHYSEVVAEKIEKGEFAFPQTSQVSETCEVSTTPEVVTWHDSCHIGRVSGVYEPPRQVIQALPNVKFVEMDHNREEAHCCGSVLTLIKEPDVAAKIGGIRLQEAMDAGATKVLALCPCCEFQLRVSAKTNNMPIEVVDLARYASEKLGYILPDPHPEVYAQWAVFEAMINLMTPQGFANLMGTMWPDLIDAMPLGMGPMMRFLGRHTPFMLDAMKPMFPILFPRLLPMMMPKVMSTMLDRVEQAVPMPDYMREQMPDLMPKVMDNLMPHMIGDVVPLVMQPMVDYLKDSRN